MTIRNGDKKMPTSKFVKPSKYIGTYISLLSASQSLNTLTSIKTMSTYSTPAHPTTTAPHANYGAILKGHHKAVKAHDGNTYHVFAIGGSPPFGDNGRQYDFNVAFSLGPISLGVSTYSLL
jgi:hypothetical protein